MAESETYRERAKRIIESNNYMVLSTCDKKGSPWACTVLFVHDDDYNFYFQSAVDSRHALNLSENPRIAFVIFDSTQDIGSTDSIQAEGKVALVGEKEIKGVISIYTKKVFKGNNLYAERQYVPGNYLGAAEFRFFKIKVERLFTNTGPGRRSEVDL